MESKNVKLVETERGWRKRVKGDKLPVIRGVTSGHLMFSIVTTVNSIALYILKLLKQHVIHIATTRTHVVVM